MAKKEIKVWALIGVDFERDGFLEVLENMEIPVKEVRELTPCELMSLGVSPIQLQKFYVVFFEGTEKTFNKALKKAKKAVKGCRRIF